MTMITYLKILNHPRFGTTFIRYGKEPLLFSRVFLHINRKIIIVPADRFWTSGEHLSNLQLSIKQTVPNPVKTRAIHFDLSQKNRNSICFSSIASGTKSVLSSSNNDQEVHINTTSSMELQQPQLEKLSQSSQLFFDCHEEMNSNQKEREIMRLVKEWGKLWRKQIYTPPNFVVENRKNYDKSVVDTDVLQNGVETVDRLAHILLDMKEKSLNLSNIKTKPSPKKGKTRSNHNHDVIFNVAVGGWAKAPPSQMNGIKASKILKRVEDIYRKCPENLKVVQPSSMSYGAALHAWSISVDSPNINGAIEAERILEDMKKAYTSGNNPFAKPSIIAYNSCLQGYSLRGMVKEVEVLLNEMEKHCDKIDSSNNESNDCLCPDVVSYTICINAYAKSKSKNAANRAEKLLQKMVKRFERTGNIRFRPNQYTFGSVIALYTKNNAYEGAQNAERILQWLIGLYEKELNSFNDEGNGTSTEYLKPSILHFMTVLLAYSSRRIRGAAVKAQKLLVQMENLYQAGNEDLKPTYKCFIICLDILVKSNEKDAAEKAEQVLDRLEDSYLNDRDSELNNYAYNLVLNAWARSGDKGAFERSEKVINRMKVVYNKTLNKTVRPDKVSYTALMNTLINTREPGTSKKTSIVLNYLHRLIYVFYDLTLLFFFFF